jgi:hypothetical protein
VRTLADELNRFDRILDGLAEALNESIAYAAREGGRLAVREAVGEYTAELRSLLPLAGPSLPSLAVVLPCPAMAESARVFPFIRSAVARVAHGSRLAVTNLLSTLASGAKRAGKVPAVVWRRAKPVLVPVITGMVLGAGAYSVATDAGAALSAAAGAFVSLAVRSSR